MMTDTRYHVYLSLDMMLLMTFLIQYASVIRMLTVRLTNAIPDQVRIHGSKVIKLYTGLYDVIAVSSTLRRLTSLMVILILSKYIVL